MNNLYQQLNQSSSNMAQIRQFANMVKGNPQALMQNNPQMKQVMQMVQQSGKTPKEYFYQLAQQKGINPDEVIQMFK